MTAAVVNYSQKGKMLNVSRYAPDHLIPVVFKRSRLTGFKAFGEILNPNAVHGNGFVTRRVKGQDPVAIMAFMKSIIEQREEVV